jgi:hypothetical protein
MTKKINVLVFPAGEINSVELHDALSTCVNLELYGASSVERHGKYIFKNYISDLPFISDDNFIEVFNHLIEGYQIDVIFPTHDTVALFLIVHQSEIKAKIIAGDKETSSICRSKIKTYNLFSGCFFLPKRYLSIDEINEFPVFIKPDEGQGAIGTKLISESDDISSIDFNESLVTEFLPGEEYTVDCLTDKNGKLRVVSPRSRNRLMAGVSVSGKTEELTEEINTIAEEINSRLKFFGLWYFQIKKNRNGLFKLLEISTRCAGSMCLTRARGVNLPLLSVYTAMGYDIEIFFNPYNVEMDRTLIGRYIIDYDYDNVYLDFDDTITLNGKVNLNTVRFLYQCRNKQKKIILLTKHLFDIHETLSKYAISNSLFDKVIKIKEDDDIINHINPDKAIFIDNAYEERTSVYKKYGIPVFDVDGIEFLLDWKN